MKIYLAGPSAELDRVFKAADDLVRAGHSVTEQWWARIEEAKNRGWGHDAEVPADYMTESAERNRVGIEVADVVIALCRSTGGVSSGCAGEIGYALAERESEQRVLRKEVILVGDLKGFVWSWLISPSRRVGTMDEALWLIRTLDKKD